MIRKTSIEIFNKIKANGLLSKRRFEVYECIFNNGPSTALEILDKLDLKTNQSGRFTELSDRGCITAVGTKKCSITGNQSLSWDVTCDLPRYTPRVLTKKQKKKKLLKDMVKLGLRVDMNEECKKHLRDIYSQAKDL